MFQIGTVVENWEGIIITAIWYWQKCIQEREPSLAKTVILYPWNMSLGLDRCSDVSSVILHMLRRDGPGRGSPWWTLLGEQHSIHSQTSHCWSTHKPKFHTPKAGPQVIPEQFSPARGKSSAVPPYTCLIRALRKVSVQTSVEMAKIIQAELLIILLSTNKYLLRVNSMCQSSMPDERNQRWVKRLLPLRSLKAIIKRNMRTFPFKIRGRGI